MESEIEKLSTELVNNLCRLDMEYTFTSDEFDEILKRIELLEKAVKNERTEEIENLAHEILHRVNRLDTKYEFTSKEFMEIANRIEFLKNCLIEDEWAEIIE